MLYMYFSLSFSLLIIAQSTGLCSKAPACAPKHQLVLQSISSCSKAPARAYMFWPKEWTILKQKKGQTMPDKDRDQSNLEEEAPTVQSTRKSTRANFRKSSRGGGCHFHIADFGPLLKAFFEHSPKKIVLWFSKNEGGWKAVWNFSENSSDLVAPTFPYWGLLWCEKVWRVGSPIGRDDYKSS